MELTELPTHVKGARRVTASRWPDREKKIDHSPRIHSLTRSPTHTSVHSPNYAVWIHSPNHPVSIYSIYSPSIYLLTQHLSTHQGSIYLSRIQSSGAKVIFFNLQIRAVHESTTHLWAQGTSPSLSSKTVPGVHSSPITAHEAQYPIQLPHTKRCHSFQRRHKYLLQPTDNQSRLDIIKQRLTSGPGALDRNRS